VCPVRMSQQTAIISLYSINWLVFITEMECVYCAVRTGSSKTIKVSYIRGNGTVNSPCNGAVNPPCNGTVNPPCNGTVNPPCNGTVNPPCNGPR